VVLVVVALERQQLAPLELLEQSTLAAALVVAPPRQAAALAVLAS
jgi:hypothetical protein